MISPVVAGFGLGLSLIVAIGAQNLFVLRQGVRREHAVAVALVCALSDAALIALGVSGLGLVLHAAPGLIDGVRWAGAAFLAVYAALAGRRALRPRAATLRVGEASARPRRRAAVILTCLALTWLNPHVYLDTVFLLGAVANAQGDGRWWFALGAVTASVLWFFALALGARRLGGRLATPTASRLLDGGIAVVMGILAVRLAGMP